MFATDAFYHIRHAWLYRVNGVFDSSFPWVQDSVIRTSGADLWYGFHILLIPFTYVHDLITGIQLAGTAITFIALASCYFAFRNLGITFPSFWTMFLLLSSSDVLWRLLMTRPHPLTLGLAALIYSFFYTGPSWPIFLLSFALSWVHSSMFWFPLVSVVPILLFDRLNARRWRGRSVGLLLGGTALGLLARPNPLANLRLVYIQVVEVFVAKSGPLSEMIGPELQPPVHLMEIILVIAMLFAAAAVYSQRVIHGNDIGAPGRRVILSSSFVMCIVSGMMYCTARRAIDLLALFVMMFFALAATDCIARIDMHLFKGTRAHVAYALATLLSVSVGYSLPRAWDVFTNQLDLPAKFEEPSTWLRDHTPAGAIVFNLHWAQFPALFYWNQHNYYIYGMDPVFLYDYDRSLYWKLWNLWVRDPGGVTCGRPTCDDGNVEPAYEVLTRDFRASYVFVRRLSETRFVDYLESDRNHFRKVYDRGLSLIFQVLPEEGASNPDDL